MPKSAVGDSRKAPKQTHLLADVFETGPLLRLQSRAFALSHVPGNDPADADPKYAKDLSIVAQVNPDKGTHHNSHSWNEHRKQDFFLRSELVAHQRGGIYTDECDECS